MNNDFNTLKREERKPRFYPKLFEAVETNPIHEEINHEAPIDESRNKNTLIIKPVERGTGHIPGFIPRGYQIDTIAVLKGLDIVRKKPGEYYFDETDSQTMAP
jgi:hypothetical protein